jgi:type I restriction enzyme, S subunit
MNENRTYYKSSGIEWLGNVPDHWEVSRAKFVSRIFVPQRNKPELNKEEGIPWLTMEDMKSKRVTNTSFKITEESSKLAGSKILKKGSVVASCVGNLGISTINDVDVIINQQLQAFIPSQSIIADYLRELVGISGDYFQTVATEATVVYVNQLGFANMPVLLPPKQEQKKIIDYLDRETTEIDALIAEKEHMLTLLDEKREALISHAVTHGLDPSISMKPSGIDWIGDIPQHWKLERAKNLFSVRDERSKTGDEELLSVSHITGVTARAEKQVYMFKAEDMTGYKRCMKEDFITNTLWAWMGAMGISPLDGIVSPDYHVYAFKGDLLPEFMELLCRSKPFIAEVIRWSKGVWSSRLRLYPESFFEIQFPVPPKSEQQDLIAKIEEEDGKSRDLKKALMDSIVLLRERRSSLIIAAVTGQIAMEDMVI